MTNFAEFCEKDRRGPKYTPISERNKPFTLSDKTYETLEVWSKRISTPSNEQIMESHRKSLSDLRVLWMRLFREYGFDLFGGDSCVIDREQFTGMPSVPPMFAKQIHEKELPIGTAIVFIKQTKIGVII